MSKNSTLQKDIIQSIKELHLLKKWKFKANPIEHLFTKDK